MKRSPEMQKLEEVLRSSKLAAGGFLGSDDRPIEEILEADAAALTAVDRTAGAVAVRMLEISDAAKKGLGTHVDIGDRLEAWVSDVRGPIVCPWPHGGRFEKTVTTVQRKDTGEVIQWSDLSIHMIKEHGFFEGRGAGFRIEPADLIRIIF